MMTEIHYEGLSDLASNFLKRFVYEFHDLPYEFQISDGCPQIIIPARNPDFGELNIWLDDDEITIGIGKYFHTHFSTSLPMHISELGDPEKAINRAVEFIRDVLQDKMILHLEKHDGRLASASLYEKGFEPSNSDGSEKTARQTWSGPYIPDNVP